jgi:hypothetical protein
MRERDFGDFGSALRQGCSYSHFFLPHTTSDLCNDYLLSRISADALTIFALRFLRFFALFVFGFGL